MEGRWKSKIFYTKKVSIQKRCPISEGVYLVHPTGVQRVFTDYPNFIASGRLDKDHIVRIVYKIEGDIITVITFFPAKKGRYY